MTVGKQDYIKDCNDQGVSLEDFRLQFCTRCLQPECTRSQHGKSRFDQRVHSWESRLFLDIPRMDGEDPRFVDIRAQKFMDMGRTPEVQAWVDPQDLVEPEPEPEPEPNTYEIPKTTQIAAETITDLDEQGPKPAPAAPANTSNRRGQMLGGKKVDVKAPQPVSDPWVPKKAPKGEVVQPGAKIRLGGS
jgi:hypothetical protein